MVEADFSGNYLNSENAKENDIIVILGEGSYEDKEWGRALNIPVEINGNKKVYTPSRTSGNAFVKAWGKDTKLWIGKKATIKIVTYKSFGELKKGIECEPIL